MSYKKLQHLMLEKDMSNPELMRKANIITKIKNGQYMTLNKVESICIAMECTPNDILEFVSDKDGIANEIFGK